MIINHFPFFEWAKCGSLRRVKFPDEFNTRYRSVFTECLRKHFTDYFLRQLINLLLHRGNLCLIFVFCRDRSNACSQKKFTWPHSTTLAAIFQNSNLFSIRQFYLSFTQKMLLPQSVNHATLPHYSRNSSLEQWYIYSLRKILIP